MAVAAYWLNEHHHSALYEHTAVKHKYVPMQVLNTQLICNCVCYKCVISLLYLSMKSFLNIFLLSLLICLEMCDSIKLIKLLQGCKGLGTNKSQIVLGSEVIGLGLHLKTVVGYSALILQCLTFRLKCFTVNYLT